LTNKKADLHYPPYRSSTTCYFNNANPHYCERWLLL